MGEYFCWVNVDRKEYIDPCDFDLGCKRIESMARNNPLIMALYDLLSEEWKGCRILFLGDECEAPDNYNADVFDILLKDAKEHGTPGYLHDTIYETYRNVSCFFKAAEKDVRDEIGFYFFTLEDGAFDQPNVYGIDVNDPYKGLFLRDGKSFKYIINRTKRVCYSLDETQILDENGMERKLIDPLPSLMGYGKYGEPGPWIGDIIEVSDTLPENCILLNEIRPEWYY